MFGKVKDIERFEQMDYENELGRLKAEKEGTVYFGLRYENDFRSSEEKEASRLTQRNKIWWL